jgi:hypothetical protein
MFKCASPRVLSLVHKISLAVKDYLADQTSWAYDRAMRILIDGLPPQFSSEILTDLLHPYGTVLSADIFRDQEGDFSGLGTVVMAQPQEAEQVRVALEEFDGIPLMVLIGDEPLSDMELTFETLESVVEFGKGNRMP